MEFDMFRINRDLQIVYEGDREEFNRLPENEKLKVIIKSIPDKRRRSNEQLNLYWACCQLIADNSDSRDWNTKEKVDEQLKIACKHYEYYVYYQNEKTGEKTLNVKTRSISFENLKHIEACGYFTESFKIMASLLQVDVEKLEYEAKLKMGGGM